MSTMLVSSLVDAGRQAAGHDDAKGQKCQLHGQWRRAPHKAAKRNARARTLNRRTIGRASIGMAYALGSAMLVPWDIYIPSDPPTGKRFFGSAAQFGDLFGFVRAQASLLEAASSLAPGYEPALAGMERRHTGKGGDGKRWRLPTEAGHSSIGRAVNAGSSAVTGSCAWHCRMDMKCVGFFVFEAAYRCYVLYQLEVVDGTGMTGKRPDSLLCPES